MTRKTEAYRMITPDWTSVECRQGSRKGRGFVCIDMQTLTYVLIFFVLFIRVHMIDRIAGRRSTRCLLRLAGKNIVARSLLLAERSPVIL